MEESLPEPQPSGEQKLSDDLAEEVEARIHDMDKHRNSLLAGVSLDPPGSSSGLKKHDTRDSLLVERHVSEQLALEESEHKAGKDIVATKLLMGGVFLKFDGKRKTSFVHLWCGPDFKSVHWGPLKKNFYKTSKSSVGIGEITGIHPGFTCKRSVPWRNVGKEFEDMCFTVATKSTTLDFQCVSAQERDLWVVAFRHLLTVRARGAEALQTWCRQATFTTKDDHAGAFKGARAAANTPEKGHRPGHKRQPSEDSTPTPTPDSPDRESDTSSRSMDALEAENQHYNFMSREMLVESVRVLRDQLKHSVPESDVIGLKRKLSTIQAKWLAHSKRERKRLQLQNDRLLQSLERAGLQAPPPVTEEEVTVHLQLDKQVEDQSKQAMVLHSSQSRKRPSVSETAAGADIVGTVKTGDRVEKKVLDLHSVFGSAAGDNHKPPLHPATSSPTTSTDSGRTAASSIPPHTSNGDGPSDLQDVLREQLETKLKRSQQTEQEAKRMLSASTRKCTLLEKENARMKLLTAATVASLATPWASADTIRSTDDIDQERAAASGYLDRHLRAVTSASVASIPVSQWMEEIAKSPQKYRQAALPDEVVNWTPAMAPADSSSLRRTRTALAVQSEDMAASQSTTALQSVGSEGKKLASLFDGLKTQWELANIVLEDQEDACLPKWVPDREAPNCQMCDTPFTLLRRRHHCRMCGGVFCSDCTPQKADLVKFAMKKVRVCSTCFGVLKALKTPVGHSRRLLT